ncbi:hypothetical protein SAMN05443663_102690 [Flavobacterium defluvii]|uniref:Uncharacterized protein n=1 Tax=Flavobacterium defluvii TaxID=370979 RepID=A0A1M5JE60_9FLAO|nr:hypothetical protein SAMN05443663_102690 [Flavobacterium defluvii]
MNLPMGTTWQVLICVLYNFAVCNSKLLDYECGEIGIHGLDGTHYGAVRHPGRDGQRKQEEKYGHRRGGAA